MAADTRRTVVALLAGAVAVIVAGWYDAYVVPNLRSGPDPDLGGALGANAVAVGAGYVAVAAERPDPGPAGAPRAQPDGRCRLSLVGGAGHGGRRPRDLGAAARHHGRATA